MLRQCLLGWLLLLGAATAAFADQGFSVMDMNGTQHHWADYKGKWVLVNYWATWCAPCLEEIPDLVALYDAHKDKDLMVIGVVLEYKSAKQVADFVDDMLMSYPIVLGDEKVMAQIGPGQILPTTYIFNPQGKLVKTKHGVITRQYIEKLISGN
ncbi:MAG: TlpA disulfide reductase family protein [Methylophilaceae bacterium]